MVPEVSVVATARHRVGSRKRRRWPAVLILVAIGVGAIALFHLGGGWYFASRLQDEALDAVRRREQLAPDYTVKVVSVGEGSITLANTDDDVARPGVWGVRWPDGYGLVREIGTTSDDTVTRQLTVVSGTAPQPGTFVDVHVRAFPDDPAAVLGEPPEVVAVDGPLGRYETWRYQGTSDTWVLLLHGNGLDRLDLAKLLPTIRAAGHPVLFVTMRNDPGAPLDPSGMLRYGDTEWADLEAAVRYASGQGAEHVVLVAPSMGAAVALTFLERSVAAGSVVGAVFDAPLVDFGRAVDAQAADERVLGLPLPRTLVASAKWLASRRFDLDWDALGHLDETAALTVPVLVFHGTADGDVPIETSRELAAARADLVTLVEVEGAPHLASWNLDPAAYEGALGQFLERVTG